MTFKSTDIKESSDNTYELTGNLTLPFYFYVN